VTYFTIIRGGVFLLGSYLVVMTLSAAVLTFVLPRSANVRLTRWIVRSLYLPFRWRANRSRTYEDRDRVMALFGPLMLLAQPVVWVVIVLLGYMGMYWAIGPTDWSVAFRLSGASVLTLGSASASGLLSSLLTFTEAAIGLGLIALLIAYLPAIYSAFSRRETAVAMLEIRAGSPPSATTLIERAHRLGRLDRLNELWLNWEFWFTEIEETHTSLSALVFFRSPRATGRGSPPPAPCWTRPRWLRRRSTSPKTSRPTSVYGQAPWPCNGSPTSLKSPTTQNLAPTIQSASPGPNSMPPAASLKTKGFPSREILTRRGEITAAGASTTTHHCSPWPA